MINIDVQNLQVLLDVRTFILNIFSGFGEVEGTKPAIFEVWKYLRLEGLGEYGSLNENINEYTRLVVSQIFSYLFFEIIHSLFVEMDPN